MDKSDPTLIVNDGEPFGDEEVAGVLFEIGPVDMSEQDWLAWLKRAHR